MTKGSLDAFMDRNYMYIFFIFKIYKVVLNENSVRFVSSIEVSFNYPLGAYTERYSQLPEVFCTMCVLFIVYYLACVCALRSFASFKINAKTFLAKRVVGKNGILIVRFNWLTINVQHAIPSANASGDSKNAYLAMAFCTEAIVSQ